MIQISLFQKDDMSLISDDKCMLHIAECKNNLLFFIAIAFQPLLLQDWELRVQFKVHGQGKKNLNGDGLAIWLTRDRMKNGRLMLNVFQHCICNFIIE